ncbi:taste receptor type 2 member 14-like [Phyllostomus hastatus]|uniref:taste receptor type 2 member 14-like n=1 Tax=Phyllostomus hastatus TaxID=9423 RepID=UPI001E6840DA|nr:taste receptor type 2 member 14-like [Phyllostomus hastatus]
MGSALHNFFIIVVNTEFIIGIVGNGFIILVNCIDWLKKRKISSVDRILTALAISRICVIWMEMMTWFAKDFYPSSFMNKKEAIYVILGVVASYLSNWFATGLSLFYFLKIANFSNPVFLCLKHRVKMVVQVMLLGALVFLPLNISMASMYINIQIHPYEGNTTLSFKRSNTENFTKLIILIVGDILPFLIFLNSFILLIVSLWKHLKNMKHSAKGFGDLHLKAHIRAMKSVMSFLLLVVVYILSIFITVFCSEMMQNKLVFWLDQSIMNFYPSVHSFILILGNGKLRKASLAVLQQWKCCWRASYVT